MGEIVVMNEPLNFPCLMKPLSYLETPQAAEEFFQDKLDFVGLHPLFPKMSFDSKRSLVMLFLIGPETERYAPEPVYGPTGKGFLRSKGVPGLVEEKELEKEIRTRTGEKIVREFLDRVEKLIPA